MYLVAGNAELHELDAFLLIEFEALAWVLFLNQRSLKGKKPGPEMDARQEWGG